MISSIRLPGLSHGGLIRSWGRFTQGPTPAVPANPLLRKDGAKVYQAVEVV
jgi:hypothetical protein